MWHHIVLARMWDQIGLRCLVQTFALEGVALLDSVCGDVVDGMCPLACFQCADLRNSELSVASSWSTRLSLAQDKLGQWFSNSWQSPEVF